MALDPLHIAQEPLQDLLGALNGLRVFFWHMCYVTCWRVLKQCCPHMYLEDDVSMKCQSGMAFHCLSPEVTQFVLPKNHSENQTSQRSECKLCFKTTLLGQTKALKTATATRAGTSLAQEPEGDLKYTLVLPAKDAAFSMGRSFYTISPSMQGSWEKAFLWSVHKAGGLIPF